MTLPVLLIVLATAGLPGIEISRCAEPLPGVPIIGAAAAKPAAAPGPLDGRSVPAGLPTHQSYPSSVPTAGEDAWVNIKTEDFEGDFPGEWTLYGTPTWDDESYRHHGGGWSGYCVGSSVAPPGPYPNDAASWMVYGPFSLSDAVAAELNFWHWVKTEAGYDHLFWGWSTNGEDFYGDTCSGQRSAWQYRTFDLAAMCGESQVWIALAFFSDVSETDEGVYLDDIVLRKNTSSGQPDLAPYTPNGWDFPVVPANARGTHTVPGQLNPAPDTTFVDWAVINRGTTATADTFYIYLKLDGTPVAGWFVADALPPNYYVYAEDRALLVGAGTHTLGLVADSTNRIDESDETNNRWSRSWAWGGGGGGDYQHVVITSSALAERFAPLCNWMESGLGLNDTVVLTSNIYTSFTGRDNAEKVRNFIKYARQNWSTTHVLLGGDAEVVPLRLARVVAGSETGDIPCDLYYSDLDGDWDADGDNLFGEPSDSVDMYPDVFVGRVPVSNATEADRFVAKFTGYVDNPSAPYLLDVLLAGFNLDTETFTEQAMSYYETNYVPARMRPCDKVYDSHPGNHREAVLAGLNAGRHIWVHSDHGNVGTLGCGSEHGWSLSGADLAALANGTDYPVLLSSACLVGAFDYSDCLTEAFVNAQHAGIAAVTNSRFGWYQPGQNPQRVLSALLVERAVQRLFSHDGDGSLEDIATAKATLVPEARTDSYYRWCMFTWNLFGEPAMPVWLPNIVGVAEPSIDRRPDARPRLCLPTHFRMAVTMTFGGDASARASLGVYDRTGRLVRNLVSGDLPAGRHALRWDGTDETGRTLPTGVYYVRFSAGGETAVGKTVLIGEE
jgi:hypothetical protein